MTHFPPDPEKSLNAVAVIGEVHPAFGTPNLLWTVGEVAQYLRLKPGTVRKIAKTGELPGIKLKRSWRFQKADIEEFLSAKRPVTSGPGLPRAAKAGER